MNNFLKNKIYNFIFSAQASKPNPNQHPLFPVVNDEADFQERVENEKLKLENELENLYNEIEAKNKDLIMTEIKNEVLKRMIFEETEKYRKYADYDF